MKKFLFACCALALSLPCVAADANNIKMVTYFPVPYASYGDLVVNGTCDIGLLGNCTLDAGAGLNVARISSDSRALNTGSVIVRNGTLALNSSKNGSYVEGRTLSAGSGSSTGVLEFAHDLAVGRISASSMQSAQAQNVAYMNGLTMFGHDFPACPESNREINWQKLTIRGNDGVFLVCGAGDTYECEPPAGESSTQACPSGYSGTQTRTWDKVQCKWSAWTGTCTPNKNYVLKLISTTGGNMLGNYPTSSCKAPTGNCDGPCPSPISYNGHYISACSGMSTAVSEGDSCSVLDKECFDAANCRMYGNMSDMLYPYTKIYRCVEK